LLIRSIISKYALSISFEGISISITRKLFYTISCCSTTVILGLQISASKICGGGAKSPIWLTMAANILNLEIQLLAQEEGPAFGGALLAAVACGAYPSIKSAAQKMSKVKKVIEPDQELTALYDARYQSFRQFYPALKNCFANANAN